jgi:prepilin signal peptidase PulO-like enzyme (type II secretory pathway)
MGPLGVVAATLVGAAAGVGAGPAADRIAGPRYAPGADGHDPEDAALALIPAPTSGRCRVLAAVVVAVASTLLAVEFTHVEVWAFFAVLTWACVVAAIVDLQYLRLPDVVTLPAAAFAVTGSVVLGARFDRAEAAPPAIVAAVAAAAVLWGVSAFFRAVRGKEAFGLGDVKLQLSLGASAGWLGWSEDLPVAGPVSIVLWVALAGFLIGSLAGLPAAGFKLSRHIPFGPFLMVGWFVVVLAADSLRG